MEGFLLFTSFSGGDHSNVFYKTVDEVIEAMRSAIDAEERDLLIFNQEEHEIRKKINNLINANDDYWHEATDSTWFTVTKTFIDCK